ncbi:hypothetical protein [Halomontanus rarus]|uniref:hypothetical protein n=1 Tax=Halomontanus rarus TaxID=3034020 RepID=UPI0023E8E5F4|nr:hypothetical protein [Halovivax sp. TS33]
MNRRYYFLNGISICVVSFSGCLSFVPGKGDETDLAPPEDKDVETVATVTLGEDRTPVCADGESLIASVEGSNAEYVTSHEFVRDSASGRYGVRGRIKPGERGNIPSIFAEFSDNTRVTDHTYGVEDDETYLFTILADKGDPDAISSYSLTVNDGATADIGTVPDNVANIKGKWGQIGKYDGGAVYGCTATVTNEYDEELEVYPRCKAYLNEKTVAYSGKAIESVVELAPGETASVYFPYLRCDPGAIADVETCLEWSTMNTP